MNWEAVGAIAEAVGALGVIATLAYLALQIRHATAASRTSAFHEMANASAEFNDMLSANADLARIFRLGQAGAKDLDPDERQRFHHVMLSVTRRLESFHHQVETNFLAGGAGVGVSALDVLASPGGRVWWGRHAKRFNPAFVEWVDQTLEDGPRELTGPTASEPGGS